MHRAFRIIKEILFGKPKPPSLEEQSYPVDAKGRPDLRRFTRPAAHYAAYVEEYLESLGPSGPADSEWQVFAYRKHVFGVWGLIACGPPQALPYVLRFLRSKVPEGRSAGAGVLDAWATDGTLVPHLLDALGSETDIETLSILAGTLGRLRVREALPQLARLLRSPNADEGDLSWSVMEAVADIARKPFRSASDPKRAADDWLREQGY